MAQPTIQKFSEDLARSISERGWHFVRESHLQAIFGEKWQRNWSEHARSRDWVYHYLPGGRVLVRRRMRLEKEIAEMEQRRDALADQLRELCHEIGVKKAEVDAKLKKLLLVPSRRSGRARTKK